MNFRPTYRYNVYCDIFSYYYNIFLTPNINRDFLSCDFLY